MFSIVRASLTTAAGKRIMFTYAWDGKPLPAEDGFLLRVYIPDLYGMKR
jgi:DMSO/TMAO reductase YedYZ molybdopterin-dependent catalytic subunit